MTIKVLVDDCASQCPGASGTGCGPNGCECYYNDPEPQYAEGEGPGEPGDFDNNGEAPVDNGGDAVVDSGTSDGGDVAPPPADTGGDTGGDVGITGNAFLDYMDR